MSLIEKTCVPCHGGVPPLTGEQIAPLLAQLKDWSVIDNHHLQKVVKTKDFQEALLLANKIGALAEQQQHHPDLQVSWGQLGIKVFTHAIDALSESDFILGAKIDKEIEQHRQQQDQSR